jgi:hypothetical protein
VLPHSPGAIAVVPTVRRRQSFQYVMPSQPQTGMGPSSQTTGRVSHVPATSSQSCREQNIELEQSRFSTQRVAGCPEPGSSEDAFARTISSLLHADASASAATVTTSTVRETLVRDMILIARPRAQRTGLRRAR